MAKRTTENQKALSAVLTASLLATGLLTGLVGCGAPGSDPTAQYSDLGAVVPPHEEKARTQAVIDRSYLIDPEKDVTFIEGETASFKIRVHTYFPVDSYQLKVVDLPNEVGGFSLSKLDTEPGTYVATWAAPKGFIPADKIERSIFYRLELADVRSQDPSVEALFRSINRVQDFSFRVRRNGQSPEIVRMSELPTEINQGQMTTFTVDVSDPASYDGYAPRLDSYFRGTNKTESGYEANGATYVRVESVPKHLGNGVWRFQFVFDTKNNDVGAQLDRDGKRVDGATHLQTRMFFKAYSASGGVSSEKLVLTKIKYAKPQVAVVKQEVCTAPAPAAKPAAAAKPATKTEEKK
ncbi:MAG: hypothetical protein RBT63_04250 [Bdellovibrionales bacterium]|jgi:hypothetical protein|nr:hypothetical protein [Bdellovibrionales bacterium]